MTTPHDPDETMRAIGRSCDMTSHKVGKALTEAGLRDGNGHPTQEAFRLDVVRTYTLHANGKRAYLWLADVVRDVAIEWAKKNFAAS
jgi:hypothetical protein